MPMRVFSSPPLGRRKVLGLLAALPLGCLLPGALWAASGQEMAASGQTLLASGNVEEAVRILRDAAKADPANPWVWNLLGRAQLALGDAAQAAQAFRSALRADPADGYAQMMLDMFSQRPLPPFEVKSVPEARPGARKRLSPLEEQAQAERRAFAAGQNRAAPRLVLLDPGHGGPDQGVSGRNGLTEKAVTLDLAKLAAEALEGLGVRAALTREADYATPLWARAAMAGLYGPDAFVSLHATAAEADPPGMVVFSHTRSPGNGLAAGVAALENGVARFESRTAPAENRPGVGELLGGWRSARISAQSQRLALGLAGALTAPAPLEKTVADQAQLTLLGMVRAPAVLVECGFLSSPSHEQALSRPHYRRELALALAQALVKVLDETPAQAQDGAPHADRP